MCGRNEKGERGDYKQFILKVVLQVNVWPDTEAASQGS